MDNRKFDDTRENITLGNMPERTTGSIPKQSRPAEMKNDVNAADGVKTKSESAANAKTAYFSAPKADDAELGAERIVISSASPQLRNVPPQRRAPAPAGQVGRPQTGGAAVNNDATKAINSDAVKAKTESKQKVKKAKQKSEMSEAGNTVVSLLKCMAYITAVFVVSIIISVVVIFMANDMYGFVKSEDQIEITVKQNATVDDIADLLHENGIIKYKWLFKMKEGEFAGTFAAGTHTVTPRSSYDDLIYALREKPPVGISWVTIPEGFTVDEIINLLVKSGIGKKDKYVEVINNYDFDYWFVDAIGEEWRESGRTYRLEGYLFPDTYQFYNASSEEAVIDKILARFNQVFIKNYEERAAELGYTVDQIMIIASLIEKEAGTAADFGNVSSVFHNRLKRPADYPYLESDATVAYALHHETGVRVKVTPDDLDFYKSPYNSYLEKGLVPGPIANPGNSAILAALNPSETGYYFFIASDTQTYFSTNINEHNARVEQVRRENEQKAQAAVNGN